jgi:hypothetical protein
MSHVDLSHVQGRDSASLLTFLSARPGLAATIAGILDQMDLRLTHQELLEHDDPLDPAA